MQNNIFEVSRIPVPVPMWARAGHMPDWFYEQVCDYAENPSPAQREETVGQFYNRKLWTQHRKYLPSADDYRQGLLAFLSLAGLFQTPAIGLTLIATILCGLRAYAMRSVESAFVPMMAMAISYLTKFEYSGDGTPLVKSSRTTY